LTLSPIPSIETIRFIIKEEIQVSSSKEKEGSTSPSPIIADKPSHHAQPAPETYLDVLTAVFPQTSINTRAVSALAFLQVVALSPLLSGFLLIPPSAKTKMGHWVDEVAILDIICVLYAGYLVVA
jgi:hypothetical protein